MAAYSERLLKLWDDLTGYPRPPQACLVNFYDTGARMGLHQDRDESDFSAPVLSISLGDACLFRIGGTERRQADQIVPAGKRRRGHSGR
jgi:alkylated DNA repair protein (DNA oxidative demethylase)